MHRGNQAGIMYLNARYFFGNDNPAPFPVRCFAVGGKTELGFDQAGAFIRFGYGISEAIPVRRASSHIPELSQVLGSVEKDCALCPQEVCARADRSVLRAVGLHQTQQDIGVHKIRIARHQSCSP